MEHIALFSRRTIESVIYADIVNRERTCLTRIPYSSVWNNQTNKLFQIFSRIDFDFIVCERTVCGSAVHRTHHTMEHMHMKEKFWFANMYLASP